LITITGILFAIWFRKIQRKYNDLFNSHEEIIQKFKKDFESHTINIKAQEAVVTSDLKKLKTILNYLNNTKGKEIA
jgi:phage FluMu gp28-like protein